MRSILNKKAFLTVAGVATLAFSLTGCGANDNAAGGNVTGGEQNVNLIFAEVNPADTVVGQTGHFFADRVYYLSGGTINIDIQGGGVLGSEEHVLSSMIGGAGAIHMARISTFALNAFGAETSRMLGAPFTFADRDHFWNFATSDLAEPFLNETLELGLPFRSLFHGEEGFRHFFTRTEVSGIEDLHNMNLRVPGDPIMVGLVEGIGAHAVSIPFTELYSALQTGVVDGAEQPITNYEANAFPEVAPYLILNGHTLGVIQFIMMDDVWQGLSENQQNAITQASAEAQAFNRELAERLDQEALDRMVGAGVTIVEVEDLDPWRGAVANVIAENISGFEDLYDQIQAMQ